VTGGTDIIRIRVITPLSGAGELGLVESLLGIGREQPLLAKVAVDGCEDNQDHPDRKDHTQLALKNCENLFI
jgi:hypothetical protein